MEIVRARNYRTIAICISLLVHVLLIYWVISQDNQQPVANVTNAIFAESK